MKNYSLIVISGLAALGTACNRQKTDYSSGNEQSAPPPNVLFIAVDDLRPELNCYGSTHIVSPNIDRLASEGVMFTRAYCNVPVSGASRASLLTGLRPTRYRFLSYFTRVDVEANDVPTLPEYFRRNGYHTIMNSKVFHHPGDGAGSWDEEWWAPSQGSWRDYALPVNIATDTAENRGPAWEMAELPDTAYREGKTAQKAIRDLKKLKKTGKPFFLALGFYKPHLPFNAPQRYWDMYNRDSIKLASNPYRPADAPDAAMHNWGELRAYTGIPANGPVDDETARTLRHGYYASVSYTDAQIGLVLNALEDMGLAENTIVVLWGDHGWNLGEHGLWCKHCNFANALHTPLIIRAPGINGGAKCQNITEFVDIYPTLCDLAGLRIPEHLEGQSLVSRLKDPEKNEDDYAVCKWFDGVTLIRDNYFYTLWTDSALTPYDYMLYDHANDPAENVNVARQESYSQVVEQMQTELYRKWGKDFNTFAITTTE